MADSLLLLGSFRLGVSSQVKFWQSCAPGNLSIPSRVGSLVGYSPFDSCKANNLVLLFF